jgi:unsaturated rhamnogalacturonyl hydrolase
MAGCWPAWPKCCKTCPLLTHTAPTTSASTRSWTRSLLDPQHAPGPETSGTAFYTYGLLWGINHGVLNQKDYLPTVQKAWQYLTTTALQPDGTLGYVQPIGEKAIPGQVVDKNSTANFGVGAFLLAASEMCRYLDKNQ